MARGLILFSEPESVYHRSLSDGAEMRKREEEAFAPAHMEKYCSPNRPACIYSRRWFCRPVALLAIKKNPPSKRPPSSLQAVPMTTTRTSEGRSEVLPRLCPPPAAAVSAAFPFLPPLKLPVVVVPP